jgi:hypothetical protein
MGTMVRASKPRGAQDSLAMLREQTHAWWTEALAGQASHAHPVHGTNVRARVEGRTLIISGTVASERNHQELRREAQHLKHNHGITQVRDELTVQRTDLEREGLLAQTLVCVYATEEQAGFAAGYLEGHADFTADMMHVLTPNQLEDALATLHALLPDAYWDDAAHELHAGKTLLVVLVDELDAFTARELLEEETPSLRTLALPPEPFANLERVEAALRRVGRQSRDSLPERSERVRRSVRDRERATHER